MTKGTALERIAKALELFIVLESEQCTYCAGSGYGYRQTSMARTTCPYCYGYGRVKRERTESK